jgi:Kef-type K+ transport system membrane component KefB
MDPGLADAGTLTLCLIVAVVAVIVSDQVKRWIIVPAVVLEILGGIAIGPHGFGIAQEDQVVGAVAQLGLAMLMFMAGYEVMPSRIRGAPLVRGVQGWVTSLVLGLAVGIGLAFTFDAIAGLTSGLIIGLSLCTTAFSTTLPMLSDSGELDSNFGRYALAAGSIGEFGPIVAVALLLSGDRPGVTTLLLLFFLSVAALALVAASRPQPEGLVRVVRSTLETSGQLGVRILMLAVLALVWLAGTLGLDVLLGAFAAGLVARVFLSTATPEHEAPVMQRISAIGFGFLVPVFFIVTGMRFDLGALFASSVTIFLVPGFVLFFLLVRGLPTWWFTRHDLGPRDRRALSLYTATALPLVVVITTIGLDRDQIRSGPAAALVGAAMVSVLVFPLLALRSRSER